MSEHFINLKNSLYIDLIVGICMLIAIWLMFSNKLGPSGPKFALAIDEIHFNLHTFCLGLGSVSSLWIPSANCLKFHDQIPDTTQRQCSLQKTSTLQKLYGAPQTFHRTLSDMFWTFGTRYIQSVPDARCVQHFFFSVFLF